MAELKRNFMKGRMNKDLDERLISNGEYKDALNIEVNTSEGSNVGSAQNVIGNSTLGSISFKQPFYAGQDIEFDRWGVPIGYRYAFRNPVYSSLSTNAEVVGAEVDERSGKIYSLVARALDFAETTITLPNSSTKNIDLGVRTDAIFETDPKGEDGYSYNVNTGNAQVATLYHAVVFNDVYEVRRQAPQMTAGEFNVVTTLDATPTSGGATSTDDNYIGTTDLLIGGSNSDNHNYLNGIEPGMEVQAIDSNGDNIWASFGKISVVKTRIVGPTSGSTTVGQVGVTFSSDAISISLANANDGVYLKFTKPRLLNFEPGAKYSYSNTNSATVSSNTPIGNKIKGLDVFDGLIYFTDGENEPKKINIDRGKRGSKRGLVYDYYRTTRLVYQDSNNDWQDQLLKEEDITVIKKAPSKPPKVWAKPNSFNTVTGPFGVGKINFPTAVPSALQQLDFNGADSINSNGIAKLKPTRGGVSSGTEVAGLKIGDKIKLHHDGWVVDATVKELVVNGVTHTDNALSGTVARFVDTAKVKIDGYNKYLETDNPGAAINWDMTINSSRSNFDEKFIRFAYRYKYLDGEVSAIGPFTAPVFLSNGQFAYNEKEGYNLAMTNAVREMVLHGFIPYDIPKEVTQVDLLYKEDGVNNIYLLKSVKKGEKVPVATVVNNSVESVEVDAWTRSGLGGVREGDKGLFVVKGNTFGSVIPSNQILRTFDAVPRKAKAQCITANRIVYGNYTEGYDLVDANGNELTAGFYYPWYGVDGPSSLSVTTRSTPPFKTYTLSEFSSSATTRFTLHDQISSDYFLESVGYVPHNSALNTIGDISGAAGTLTSDQAAALASPRRYGVPSIKSGRTYTVGVVYSDKFGRQSPVILGNNCSFDLPYNKSYESHLISLRLSSNVPDWADSYKFFIKEDSNEYYNIALFKAYQAKIENGVVTEIWLSFNSADRNKVEVGDYLIPKKKHNSNTSNSSKPDSVKYKIIDISNEAPKKSDDDNENDDGVLPSGITIAKEDKAAKFFAKVKFDTDLEFFIPDFNEATRRPAIFEVEPDPKVDFNVFYEASQSFPIKLNKDNIYNFVNIGDKCFMYHPFDVQEEVFCNGGYQPRGRFSFESLNRRVVKVEGPKHEDGYARVWIYPALPPLNPLNTTSDRGSIHFIKPDGTRVASSLAFPEGLTMYSDYATVLSNYVNVNNRLTECSVVYFKADQSRSHVLPWNNCYSFNNGIESDRIRDDFNARQMDNGVKVSTTSTSYKQNTKENSLIYSGIYNSKNGVNNLNEFISAEGITKDLNPQYGGIQLLNARRSDVSAFCEQRVVRILANKEALFNADSSGNITSSKNVLGHAEPYSGEYGIGTNPESFAKEEFRSYFVDKSRGAVLRLSKDGLTKISDVAMGDYFSDTLKEADAIVGSYNRDKGEYDITIHHEVNTTAATKKVSTLSFSEATKGWVSFKSYDLEYGVSLNNVYYTFKNGETWEHKESALRNNFYGVQYNSTITPVVNDMPGVVKSFTAVNYEGTQARVIEYLDDDVGGSGTHDKSTYLDGAYAHAYNAQAEGFVEALDITGITDDSVQYYNNLARAGWYVEKITTDQQTGTVLEFLEKEGKWFNYIHGEATSFTNSVTQGSTVTNASGNLDTQEFSVQGVGIISAVASNDEARPLNQIGSASVSVTGTTSHAGISSISGSATSVSLTTNLNTISNHTITITVDECYEVDVNTFSFTSLPSHVSSITLPGTSTIIGPNQSYSFPVVYSAGAITGDLTASIPFTISTSTNICTATAVDLDVEIINGASTNLNYSITGPVATGNYQVFSPSIISGTDNDQKYDLSGTNLLNTGNNVFDITFTANSGYYITTANLFNPTETDTAGYLENKTHVYDGNGNIVSTKFEVTTGSITGLQNSAKYVFPSPTLRPVSDPNPTDTDIDLGENPEDTSPEGNFTVFFNVFAGSGFTAENMNIFDVPSGTPLQTYNGQSNQTGIVITPAPGNTISASDFSNINVAPSITGTLGGVDGAGHLGNGIIDGTFVDQPDGTVILYFNFNNRTVASDITYTLRWESIYTSPPSSTSVSADHLLRVLTYNHSNYDSITFNPQNSYTEQTSHALYDVTPTNSTPGTTNLASNENPTFDSHVIKKDLTTGSPTLPATAFEDICVVVMRVDAARPFLGPNGDQSADNWFLNGNTVYSNDPNNFLDVNITNMNPNHILIKAVLSTDVNTNDTVTYTVQYLAQESNSSSLGNMHTVILGKDLFSTVN